ncbi:hypothetical protein B0H13DRAFT_2570973 [Mycena leptocephala]|nr:hypothetical protein B0H13DRAFT_2570973 [Mycena leptocephala]
MVSRYPGRAACASTVHPHPQRLAARTIFAYDTPAAIGDTRGMWITEEGENNEGEGKGEGRRSPVRLAPNPPFPKGRVGSVERKTEGESTHPARKDRGRLPPRSLGRSCRVSERRAVKTRVSRLFTEKREGKPGKSEKRGGGEDEPGPPFIPAKEGARWSNPTQDLVKETWGAHISFAPEIEDHALALPFPPIPAHFIPRASNAEEPRRDACAEIRRPSAGPGHPHNTSIRIRVYSTWELRGQTSHLPPHPAPGARLGLYIPGLPSSKTEVATRARRGKQRGGDGRVGREGKEDARTQGDPMEDSVPHPLRRWSLWPG